MSLSIGELVGYVSLDTSKAEDAPGKMDGIISGIGGKLKGGLLAVGALAGTALVSGVMSGMDNEAAADKLAASLGGTSKDAERYGDIAGRVYSNGFGEGLEDVDTAIGAVVTSIKGMRNASSAEVQDMTERAMTFADVMGVDVTRAAQVAGNMVANGMARNGKQAFDLLMRTSQKVPVQLREDILDATDEYGQFFSQLGIKGPQAMGMLAAGAKKGMYGIDKAGDAIKEFTIRATDGSDATQTAMQGIGLNANKMANDILAGGNRAHSATQKIVKGLLDVKDPAERSQKALALFGTPLEDLSTKDIPVFLRSLQNGKKTLGDFKGSVADAGKVAYDNAKSNLTVFTRTLKTGFVDFLGGTVLPIINRAAKYLATSLGPAVQQLGKWFESDLKPALSKAAKDYMPALKDAMGNVQDAFKDAKPFLSLLGKIITKVVIPAVAKLAGQQIKALTTSMKVVAKFIGTTTKVLVAGFKWWVNAGKSVGNFFGKTLPDFFSRAWTKVRTSTSSAVSKVVGFVKSIPGKFRSGLSSLGSMLGTLFGNAMGRAKDRVTGIGGTIVGWIRDIPGKLRSLGSNFASAGADLLQRFINGMKNAAGIITGIAGNVWNTVQGLLNGAIDRINGALDFTINLPGPKDLHVNIPNIPHLATGGRAYPDGRVVAIADGGKPETVLTDPQLLALVSKAHANGVAAGQAGGSGRSAPLIGQVVQSPGESADNLAERLWFKTRTRG